MTLIEITAVKVETVGPPCCVGLILCAAVGAVRGPITAAEVATDLRFEYAEYYAMVGGRYVQVGIGHCTTCDAPFLMAHFDEPTANELLALDRLN